MLKRTGIARIAAFTLCSSLLIPLTTTSAIAVSEMDVEESTEQESNPAESIHPDQKNDDKDGEEQQSDDSGETSDVAEESEKDPDDESLGEATASPKPTPSESLPVSDAKENKNSKPVTKCQIPAGKYTGKIGSGHQQIGGKDRFETNSKITKAVNSQPVGTGRAVFIANALDFADGLSLGALAQYSGWPLMLVRKDSIDSQVLAEIKKVNPTHIYVAGGKSVVSDKVVNQVKAAGNSPTVKRFGGVDRYDTSKQIAQCYPQGTRTFLTTGENFADAVISAGPAAKFDGAIVLTGKGWLNRSASDALRSIRPSRVDVIGNSWSKENLSNVRNAIGNKEVKHIYGNDRYETSAKVANEYFSGGNIAYANGKSFPDALSGISMAEVANAPVVLTQAKCRPQGIVATTTKFSGTKIAIGGANVVSAGSYTTTCAPPRPSVSVGQRIVNKARSMEGVTGYDCSGFVQTVYRSVGKNVPRTSWEQRDRGRIVSSSPQAGDIAVMLGGGHVAVFLGYKNGTPWIADSPGGGAAIKVRPAWDSINSFVRY